MKKALVIGGSSGIGLAITKNLIEKEYHVDILTRREPEKGILPEGKYEHHYCDMLDLDEELISSFARDPELSFLMITAGIASIRTEDISGLWIPFLLTIAAGAAVTWFFLKWASAHAFAGYEREGLISMFGMLTGTIGSGILLLKELDPNLETPAANNLVIGSSYGIVLGAPMLVFVSLAARSTLMCLITLALIVIYWFGLCMLIRSKAHT